jgi:hypothetical protein
VKLWVIGASAVRDNQTGGSDAPFTVGCGLAESGDEAAEKAWKLAREAYPEVEGWGQHRIAVGAVSNTDIARVVADAASTRESE